ncbi:MAG: tRNA (adenosine(37)-N6)-threonylcarbamoyltransferase complex dimerization subunit type 1 TsaB [Candidatus Desulfatibia sp.]|uniref:tRNA (adenosine(37)-N6)-threonylcarbamoyltransferase complex dimerization subunit type 1 TsaB n=1 Tax=Candidatus Desulfatibia sp. TaxID=3101189 RepID=UPI002F2BC626
MKILAVDTSTTSCSVAVVDKDLLLAEMTIDREQTHSKHLMDMIHTVMGFSGLAVSALDGFAVTRGPGTFTGLRIGISTIKGLAVASGKPLVGISSLDALAEQCACSAYLICVLLDARKGEVYFAGYRFQNGVLKKEIDERVLPPRQAVRDINEPSLLVGNGARLYQDTLAETMGGMAFFAWPCQNTIRASTVAWLSMSRFEKTETDDVATFVPQYIRKPAAELNYKKSESVRVDFDVSLKGCGYH